MRIQLTLSTRTEEYQKKIDAFAIKGLKVGEVKIARSRREVVQHAAAFQHMITIFVKRDQPMTEQLIKDTHAILVRGLSGENAGVFNSKPYGGSYRHGDERAFAGAHEFAKPSEIPKAMRSLVDNLQADIAKIQHTGYIDPWRLAAKYCDRMVNVHPFKDGNGRMCRIILNSILIKYVGFVVALGEKDADRDEYMFAAQESGKVGGFPGYLSTMVLKNAGGTLERLKGKLKRQSKSKAGME
jgi:Fic family protein